MIAKTEKEINSLREGGKRLGEVLKKVGEIVKPGVTTAELNEFAEKLIQEKGDTPAFLGYIPEGADRPYPATLCVSVNDEIVHGIPNEEAQILKEGDIVGLDCGLIHDDLIVDAAITVGVGKIGDDVRKLIEVTRGALTSGIAAAHVGGTVGDIGLAIETYSKPYGYGIVRELGGHGVGKKVHEEPYIPNFGEKGTGDKLTLGMVIALEPMLNEGTGNIVLARDGYTFKTADGKRSAHFEHTILITEGEAEVLTK